MGRAKNFMILIAALGGGLLASCEAVPDAQPVALQSPEAQRVQTALERLPRTEKGGQPVRRTFSTTLRLGGGRSSARFSASGVLLYYGPRDFRITANTDAGMLLLDARMNWAGVTVLRQMPGVDKSAIEALVRDMSRSFEVPDSLNGLAAGEQKMVLKQRLGDNHASTWIFDRQSGQLESTDINLGVFDNLRVDYSAYSAVGWPDELRFQRSAHQYDAIFNFSDSHVVEGGRSSGGAAPGSGANWPAAGK